MGRTRAFEDIWAGPSFAPANGQFFWGWKHTTAGGETLTSGSCTSKQRRLGNWRSFSATATDGSPPSSRFQSGSEGSPSLPMHSSYKCVRPRLELWKQSQVSNSVCGSLSRKSMRTLANSGYGTERCFVSRVDTPMDGTED